MWKFSVKKPLTIFVAVIAVLVLGVIAFTKMTPDLLPNMDFPYVVIVTTYPGASPEKVESEVTKPLEQAMATLEHIVQVSSSSGENYSMVMLEFEESVNMDTLGVDIQQEITALSGSWDAMVGAPYVLKINPSLLPVQVAAVSMDGMDTVQLTEFLEDALLQKLEGIPGVAQISTSGMIRRQLHVVLDEAMIERQNQLLADAINAQVDDAAKELQDKKKELEEAQQQLEDAKLQLETGKSTLTQQVTQAQTQLGQQQDQLTATRTQLTEQLSQLEDSRQQLQTTLQILQTLRSGIDELEKQMASLRTQLELLQALQAQTEALQAKRAQYDTQLQAIENDASLTEEEKAAAVLAITESEDYRNTQLQWEALQAQLTAQGVTPETLPQRIAALESTLEGLESRMEQLEQMLAQQGMDPAALDAQIAELEATQVQLDEGIAALEGGIRQLDQGLLQLKDAQALLDQKKLDGLLELSSASTELVVGSATVSNALTQLEAGLTTVEESRADALSQADLHTLVTMELLTQILTAQNFAMPAGYVEQDGVNYMVSVGDQITEQKQLEELVLFDMGMEGLDPIRVKDVAAVLLTDNRNETYAKLNGQDGIVLTFEKQSTYATAESTDNITRRFRELEQEYPGLRFEALMDQGDYIYMIVESIISSLLLGALLAVIILFLFLKDLRPTFITLCSIPISVVFAIVLMYFSGVTLNMFSLSGLAVAVGMLVDNSVVVIENIYRLRAKGANAVQAAVSGAAQVAGSVIASTLTTICVFLPIVFVEGITRQLFTDLALTMTYALLASLIVALTLVPAMASGMLKKEKNTSHRLMDRLLGVYEKSVRWTLRHKAVVLILSMALLVGSAAASLSRGYIFMPSLDMSSLTVSITMPEDADMETAAGISDEVLKRIDTLEGIRTVGAMMGSGGLMGSMGGGDGYDVTLYITLEDENASGAAVGKQITDLCRDLQCQVSASSAMLDLSMLSGSGISLNLYCDDMEQLHTAAGEAARLLEDLEGVGEVSDGLEDAAPAVHVKIDPNEAMKKGITVAQIYLELASALTDSGTAATLQLEGTSTEVIIEKPQGAKLDMQSLENYEFTVTGMDGTEKTFLLSDVAVLEQTASLNTVSRLDQRRYLSVTAQVEEGYNVTVLAERAENAMKQAQLPQGVTYEFTGENETIMEAVEQLGLMLALGVLLVYLVMVAQFQSLKSPFIVMFTVPLAFTGGFLALLLCGMEISVVSLVGFVMLVGIIVNNGIVLVDCIDQLRREGVERREAIVEAGKTRMRPILMTSITTILGLTDMAVRKSAGTAIMQPVAVVCIGGLLYATLMTLYVVPCIYDMMNKRELRKIRDEDLQILDL